MKAIILAAGRGSRMGALTDDRPKCMALAGGRPLLDHAVAALRGAGVDDILVVRGYRAEGVSAENVRFRDNPNWAGTNMLGSLFSVADEIQGDVLVCYSDILFDHSVVAAALQAEDDVGPVVDRTWRPSYVGRTHHPISEAEKVVLDPQGRVRRIGKTNISEEEADGEFIGMVKLSGRGAASLSAAFEDARRRYSEAPFQTAPRFETAYLTDLLQEMVDHGHAIGSIAIHGGWREIDTPQDLERACDWLAGPR